MTKYTVTRYRDGEAVGTIDLTPEQFARYEALAQQPEGLIRIGDKAAFEFYNLDDEYQDMSPNETVFLA